MCSRSEPPEQRRARDTVMRNSAVSVPSSPVGCDHVAVTGDGRDPDQVPAVHSPHRQGCRPFRRDNVPNKTDDNREPAPCDSIRPFRPNFRRRAAQDRREAQHHRHFHGRSRLGGLRRARSGSGYPHAAHRLARAGRCPLHARLRQRPVVRAVASGIDRRPAFPGDFSGLTALPDGGLDELGGAFFAFHNPVPETATLSGGSATAGANAKAASILTATSVRIATPAVRT